MLFRSERKKKEIDTIHEKKLNEDISCKFVQTSLALHIFKVATDRSSLRRKTEA